MAILSGPELDKLVERLKVWYAKTRLELIELLSTPYPYGSVRLTPDEQVERFQLMTEDDWAAMQAGFANKYRGLPDQEQRVEQDMQNYQNYIARLAERRIPSGS